MNENKEVERFFLRHSLLYDFYYLTFRGVYKQAFRKKSIEPRQDIKYKPILHLKGFKMRMDKENYRDIQLLYLTEHGKAYEPEVTKVMEENIQEGSVFVDVGANVGYYSLMLAKSNKNKIHAFEPSHKTYKRMIANIELNGFKNIITYNMALGNKTGRIKFNHHIFDDGRNTIAQLDDLKDDSEIIKIGRLDDIVRTKVNFIKIDVEGYEYEVLKGAWKTLKANKGVKVIMEYNFVEMKKAGFKYGSTIEFMHDLGFKTYELSEKGATLINSYKELSRFGTNIYCIRNEQE